MRGRGGGVCSARRERYESAFTHTRSNHSFVLLLGQKIPFLEWEPSTEANFLSVSHVMTRDVVCLEEVERAGHLLVSAQNSA